MVVRWRCGANYHHRMWMVLMMKELHQDTLSALVNVWYEKIGEELTVFMYHHLLWRVNRSWYLSVFLFLNPVKNTLNWTLSFSRSVLIHLVAMWWAIAFVFTLVKAGSDSLLEKDCCLSVTAFDTFFHFHKKLFWCSFCLLMVAALFSIRFQFDLCLTKFPLRNSPAS